MKTQKLIVLSILLSLLICQVVFAAGGKGNVEQLGKKLYVWHFDEGVGKQTKTQLLA
jgi:hypothetical protein